MKIFNPTHLLRQIPKSSLEAFFRDRGYIAHLAIDWSQAEAAIANALGAALADEENLEISADIHHEMQRVFRMANDAGIKAMHNACGVDNELIEYFDSAVNNHDRALWMLQNREDKFRAAELQLAFQGKTNGKLWKKHKIPPGMTLSRTRAELDAFGDAIAQLYRKDGAGRKHHVEIHDRHIDGLIQLSFYVEGPKSDSTEFGNDGFLRRPIRPAIETGLLYDPATGEIESVVTGGVRNHQKVLEIFGEHVLKQNIEPILIEKQTYFLNNLRGGIELFDPAALGIEKARLRRGKFSRKDQSGIAFAIESSPEMNAPDAAAIAKSGLRVDSSIEAEFNLNAVTIVVYRTDPNTGKPSHFSFDCTSGGSSTIKNLSAENAKIAHALLTECGVFGGSKG